MTAGGSARYLEIETWLRTRVMDGREGDPLPSEAELAAQFNVSRMTARQAVQNLAAEGLVRRQRGSGTFIAQQPMHRHSGPLTSFSVDMRGRGLTASSKLLKAELRDASAAESEALRLNPGVRVVSLVRLRLADDAPMAIEHTTLTPDAAPVLAQDLESGSLHEALRALGREPTTALTRISARLATSEETRLLRLSPRAAVLVEQKVITDQDARELEQTTTVYNASRYVLDASFTLASDEPVVS